MTPALASSLEAADRASGRRREPRHRLDLPCRLRIGGAPWKAARLFDLSSRGVLISWQPQYRVGQALWIRLPGLEPMRATVRWKDMSGAGCELERPLNAIVVEHLRRSA